MGRTHCSHIVDRLYNYNKTGKPSPTMNKSFLSEMAEKCPPRTKKGQTDPLVYLNPDSGSNHSFTSSFYSRVLSNKSVLEVDQQLLYNEDTKQISEEFSASFEDFRKSFALSMSKMGSINVLTKNEASGSPYGFDARSEPGSHSMGRTHCSHIVDRLYNFNKTGKPSPTMNKSFLSEMAENCPPRTKKGQTDPLVYLNPDSGSNHSFTSSFYSRVLSNKSVLEVDQQLLYNDDTKQISEEFSASFEDFRKLFALSMSKMGSINVLTKNEGEIRRYCRRRN
ncbi:hypothetical protein F2Q70_00028796 [Brassica cretica]|uniref:peroxidase n=1 Tax=Brassica cretica TaxID=69181 RepID=A0A8S9LC18_BRACR|nr:hypothetical protein F2Q70_00028796 [Brassica cretica]